MELTKEAYAQAIPSVQKYFREELDLELSEMRARFILEYFQQEVAPFAYNRGVQDAERYFRAKIEDLPGLCFEAPLTYWTRAKK